jgi:hypothetical protein
VVASRPSARRWAAAGIGDGEERVVGALEGDAGLRQLSRQPAVAVEVDRQAKRRPGRHAHIAQAKLCVDEVEVLVQTLAGDRLEKGLAARLVVPGAIRRAGLHGAEDVHQAGPIAALGEDLLDSVLLAERLELADVLALQPPSAARRSALARIASRSGSAQHGSSNRRMSRAPRWPAIALAWQIAGRVPRIKARSKQDNTQPIASWRCSTKGFIAWLPRCYP